MYVREEFRVSMKLTVNSETSKSVNLDLSAETA